MQSASLGAPQKLLHGMLTERQEKLRERIFSHATRARRAVSGFLECLGVRMTAVRALQKKQDRKHDRNSWN